MTAPTGYLQPSVSAIGRVTHTPVFKTRQRHATSLSACRHVAVHVVRVSSGRRVDPRYRRRAGDELALPGARPAPGGPGGGAGGGPSRPALALPARRLGCYLHATRRGLPLRENCRATSQGTTRRRLPLP